MIRTKRENQFFLSLIVLYLVISTVWGYIPITNSLISNRISVLLPEIIILIPAIVFLVLDRRNWKETIRFKKIPIVVVFLLVLLTFTITPFVSLCNAFSMLFTTNVVQMEVEDLVNDTMLFRFVSMALLPAIAEEMVYRGILGQKYMKVHWWKGVVLSAFLFGAMHMNFNQFFYAFFMGILFALLVEVTDSILASMIVHFVFNANTVLLTYAMEWIEKFANSATQMELNADVTLQTVISMIPSGIFSLALSALIFFGIGKITDRWELVRDLLCNKGASKQGEKLVSWHLVLGIVFCSIMAIALELAIRL